MFKLSSHFVVALACAAPFAFSQDELPPVKAGHIQIAFLPPPMDGTLSLGMYNKTGKLVRTLHAEASVDKDFIVGLNGLVTHWDGRDDAGHLAPPAKYFARGYCVGPLDVEGVAYWGNDWLLNDEPVRVREIVGIRMTASDGLLVFAKRVDGTAVSMLLAEDGQISPAPDSVANKSGENITQFKPRGARGPFAIRDGKLIPGDVESPAALEDPIATSEGANGTLWVIDRTSEGAAVKQFSAAGDFLRRLTIPQGDPEPAGIAASTKKEFVALLERNDKVQRVRALELDETTAAPEEGGALSNWKTAYSKSILASDTFAAAASVLDNGKPFAAEERIRIRLQPNPLFKDAVHELDLRIVIDAHGSSLAASDGLPLCRLTETKDLKWAVLGRVSGGKALRIFESDGAVVEEFRVHKLANMMAFDAGEYEWK